ncbi:MAG: AlpA family phage regulatory protein [Aliivibrio sp.]|nr:AlpA family phage regulatory protein [Aliivibrio sp.]
MPGDYPHNDAAKSIVESAQLTRLIRKHELAKCMGVSTKTIERWLKKGSLPTPFMTRTGRTIGWASHQLEKWRIENFK